MLSVSRRKRLGSTWSTQLENPHEGKNPAAVALGKIGGKKGGKARADKLSPSERKALAKKAAEARWAKQQMESEN